jgi:hypothetical protein
VSRHVLGTFDFSTRQAWNDFFEAARRAGMEGWKRVVIEDPAETKRNLDQNARYWKVHCETLAKALSRLWGYTVTKDVAHEIFREALLRVPVEDEDGNPIILPSGKALMQTRSTTELNTREFAEYMDQCGELAWDLAKVPPPEPRRELEGAHA